MCSSISVIPPEIPRKGAKRIASMNFSQWYAMQVGICQRVGARIIVMRRSSTEFKRHNNIHIVVDQFSHYYYCCYYTNLYE